MNNICKKRIPSYEEFEAMLESKSTKNKVWVRHYNHDEDKGNMIEYWEEQTQTKRNSLKNCPCCDEPVLSNESNYWVGAHVCTKQGDKYITATCNVCNSTYKNSKATEHWFSVIKQHLCQLPPQTQEY